MQNKTEINGYSLFNDIEDKELQSRNRAVVMANMAEANTRGKKLTEKGTYLVLSYFNAIPEAERKVCLDKFKNSMKERGYRV